MQTLEQLAESEELCRYCSRTDYGKGKSYYNRNGDYYSCEGAYCKEAYQQYIIDNNLENELFLED